MVLIIISCKQNSTYNYNEETVVSKMTQELVYNLLRDGGMYYSESIDNEDFIRFKDESSNEELIKLTDHRSPTIRCYAFKALVEKNHSSVIKIFYKHLYDEANLKDANPGCIKITQPVKSYMLKQLNPNSSYKYKIDSVEYKRIEEVFWE
jgi:glutaredoxin 2